MNMHMLREVTTNLLHYASVTFLRVVLHYNIAPQSAVANKKYSQLEKHSFIS